MAPSRDIRSTRRAHPAMRPQAFRLPLRSPYHAAWMFSFLAGRAIRGLEHVEGHRFRRRLSASGWLEVRLHGDALHVCIPAAVTGDATDLVARVRHLFDLNADSTAIDAHLAQVPILQPLVAAAPGLRVPGVWGAFEGTTRAILGQQVSVRRATALAAILCERFGDGAFPTPAALARAEVASIGMPGTRGHAVAAVALRVLREGDGWLKDAATLRAGFASIRGLGPWSAEYAAMRVAKDADAFPDSDWGVHKALGLKGAAARGWAEPCRPWRAYATMHLWFSRTTA